MNNSCFWIFSLTIGIFLTAFAFDEGLGMPNLASNRAAHPAPTAQERKELQCSMCTLVATMLPKELEETKGKGDTLLGNQAGKTLYASKKYAYSSLHVADALSRVREKLSEYVPSPATDVKPATYVKDQKVLKGFDLGQINNLVANQEFKKVMEARVEEFLEEREEYLEEFVQEHQGTNGLVQAMCKKMCIDVMRRPPPPAPAASPSPSNSAPSGAAPAPPLSVPAQEVAESKQSEEPSSGAPAGNEL